MTALKNLHKQSSYLMGATGIRRLNFGMFSQSLIDKMTTLKYAFIVFSKKRSPFFVYVHCLYIDKWCNLRYSFNN